jgi:DNA-binding response OmpR family regulator
MRGGSSLSRHSESRALAPGLRIVIADDDPDTVLTLHSILEDEGHEVYGFGTGREALAAARMYHADVLIVDIQMPDMTGYAISQQVRSNMPERPLLIAISGRWKSEIDMLLSVVVGFDHYFKKPCDAAALLTCINDWAVGRESRSAHSAP